MVLVSVGDPWHFGADPDPDPYLWIMDPDPTPHPSLLFDDSNDVKTIIFLLLIT